VLYNIWDKGDTFMEFLVRTQLVVGDKLLGAQVTQVRLLVHVLHLVTDEDTDPHVRLRTALKVAPTSACNRFSV